MPRAPRRTRGCISAGSGRHALRLNDNHAPHYEQRGIEHKGVVEEAVAGAAFLRAGSHTREVVSSKREPLHQREQADRKQRLGGKYGADGGRPLHHVLGRPERASAANPRRYRQVVRGTRASERRPPPASSPKTECMTAATRLATSEPHAQQHQPYETPRICGGTLSTVYTRAPGSSPPAAGLAAHASAPAEAARRPDLCVRGQQRDAEWVPPS